MKVGGIFYLLFIGCYHWLVWVSWHKDFDMVPNRFICHNPQKKEGINTKLSNMDSPAAILLMVSKMNFFICCNSYFSIDAMGNSSPLWSKFELHVNISSWEWLFHILYNVKTNLLEHNIKSLKHHRLRNLLLFCWQPDINPNILEIGAMDKKTSEINYVAQILQAKIA